MSLSPAETTVERDLGISVDSFGRVFSAFFLGYVWLQVPAGWLGHRLGARVALTAMGLGWAGAMAATAAAHSYEVLYWSRVAQGVAQAGLFAVTIMALRDWFPAGRRGAASAVITSCMSVGSVLANGLTVHLLPALGWRATFAAYAGVAAVWAVAFGAWFRNSPVAHPAVNDAERAVILGAEPDGPAGDAGAASAAWALRRMATSVPVAMLCAQAFFQAFGYVFFITWFPAWLEKGHGVKLKQAGQLTMLPLVGVVAGSFLAGVLIDLVLRRTGSRWLSRCGVAAVGLTLCAGATLAAAAVRQPVAAVAVIALGMFFSGFAKPNQWAATMDLTGRYSAVGFAVMNVAGNFGAIACPRVVGGMIDRLEREGGDWNSVLYLIAGIHLAGALAWLALNPNRPAVGPADGD